MYLYLYIHTCIFSETNYPNFELFTESYVNVNTLSFFLKISYSTYLDFSRFLYVISS